MKNLFATKFDHDKKIAILCILILSIGLSVCAQTKKGDFKLTVSVLPLVGSSDEFVGSVSGFAFKPSFGYFISDNTSIDFSFSYATLNDLRVGAVDSHYNSFSFAPSVRNYFYKREKVSVFGEIGFGLGTVKYDADNSNSRNYRHDELSGGISIFSIGVGGNYFFSKKTGLEIIIPYLSVHNTTSYQSGNLFSGIGPTIGLTYQL